MPNEIAEKAREALAKVLEAGGLDVWTATKTVTETTVLASGLERLAKMDPDLEISIREASQLSGKSRAALLKAVQRDLLPAHRVRKHPRYDPRYPAKAPYTVRAGDLLHYCRGNR